MTLLHARDISHQAGSTTVFEGLNLLVQSGDRIGLVGHNGCGKSTLLGLLNGQVEPDSGTIERRRGLQIAQVAQFLPAHEAQQTLREAIAARLPAERDWQADALLDEFAFSAAEAQRPVATLSGGQQNRLMFAQALAANPDLLLLDEPTNHLDLATMVLFEERLRAFGGACVVVSHDRAFLDAVTTATAVLRDRQLQKLPMPFSDAKAELARADAAAARRAEAEDKEIDALRSSAKRLATWGKVYDNEGLAKRAKSMEKRVEKLQGQRTAVSKGSPLDLQLELAGSRAKQMIAIDQLTIRVAGRELFGIEDFVVRPGERIALLGHNGVGKSTFVRALVAACAEPDPALRISPQAQLGYYDQELDEVAGSMTMADFVRRRTDLGEQPLRQRLIGAGFAYADHDKRIDSLSGGERARLLFVVLAAAAPNFLILDEPTNHIDIEGKEQLEAQLLASPATVVLTSHDRRFLETVATRYLLISDGRLQSVNSPQAFFASRPEGMQAPVEPSQPPIATAGLPDTEDALLEEMDRLEGLLRADRARKLKFQKPERQREWEDALAALNRQLDAL